MSDYTVSDFRVGDRVQLHGPGPQHFSRWATVRAIGRKYLTVELHLTGGRVKLAPSWVTTREA